MPDFPNVPIAPGVPSVLRLAGAFLPPVPALVLADAAGLGLFATLPTWGIFDANEQLAVSAESVYSVSYSQGYRISKVPIELGSFASYNKVASPYDFKITFTQGGTDAQRAALLSSIEAIVKSTSLFSAVTPEATYLDANPTHLDYDRTARAGSTLLVVDVWFEEIRQTASSTFTGTKSPTAAAQEANGIVQSSAPQQTTTAPTSTSAGAITAPGAQLTTATAGQVPTGFSPIGATISYDGNDGPATGVVKSVVTDKGYNLTDGSFVGTNLVHGIVPQGATAVQ